MFFRPIKTSKIDTNIYTVLTGFSNFYIFDSGDSLICFDCGMSSLTAEAGMKSLGLDKNNVSDVFITHSDYDHRSGLNLFKNANVYISKNEEKMIDGSTPRKLFMYNKKIKNYKTLSDREVVYVNNTKVQIIVCEGHTLGSSFYLINDEILVCGDNLRLTKDKKIIPFLLMMNREHQKSKESLQRIMDEGIIDGAKILLTGHTGYKKN